MKSTIKTLAVFSLLLLISLTPVLAQETTGAVQGNVTVEDGSALPGVTISVRNTENGLERAAMADASGHYNVPALQPGNYEITAQLDGFQTQKSDIRVSVGGTTSANFSMALGAIEEVITVTTDAPLIDTTSTVTGLTVNAQELNDRVPVGREVTQVALLAPATLEGDPTFDGGDAGAAGRTPGQSLTSVGGASVAENSYQINGLNITNFRNGLGSSLVPFEFLEEVQVKTGGYEAEFGRSTGGVINMVTKSGGNSMTGGFSAYFEPESLWDQDPNAGYSNNILRYNELEDREVLEANASLGGALMKDKLFFYAFAQFRDRAHTIGCGTGGGTCFTADSSEPLFGGKIDYNLTASHRLEGTYFTDESEADTHSNNIVVTGNTASIDPNSFGFGTRERGGTNYIGKYTGIFGSNVVVSAQYGVNEFARSDIAPVDLTTPRALDSRTATNIRLGQWANGQVNFSNDDREAYRADFDVLLGNHSLRAGADFELNTSKDETFYPGHVYYRYYLSNTNRHPQVAAGTEIVRVRVFEGGGEFETETTAFYAQDSWDVSSNLSVNAGVRWEQYDNKNSNGDSFIKVTDQYAPRLGAVYDVRGNGRSKVYASFGRYHLPIASNTNIRLAGGELFTENWHVLNGGINSDGSPGSLGENLESNTFDNGQIPDARSVRSENLKPEFQDEIILGYEQMVGEKWAVGARFVNREFGEVIEDLTLDQALGQPGAFCYVLANPGSNYEGFEDCDGDGNLTAVSFSADQLGFPTPERNYYAVELTANRRFSDNWMMQTSYTWSHSYGNYEGYVRSDNGQDDAGITTLYDFAGLLDNGYGNLPNDRRHNFKVFGAYQFDMGLQVGGQFQYRSGRPINAFGVHPTDSFSALYGAESFFNQGTAVDRGSVGTTDSVWYLNLNTKYDFSIGPAAASLRVDVFNVTANDEANSLVETADEENGGVDTDYLAPLTYQNPQRVRLGLTLRF